MNTAALIPLIATIAYIPLLVIVLMNRPWQLKQKLFFLFLVSAMLWSATDVFFRLVASDSHVFFMQYKLLLLSIVLCLAIWMIIQFRYLGQSFYKTEVIKRPFAYIILAASIILAILGLMPRGLEVVVSVTDNIRMDYFLWLASEPQLPAQGFHVDYGIEMLLLVGSVLILGGKDIYHLVRRLKISDNAVERNQIIYFFVAFACLAVLGFATLIPLTPGTVPVAHIGNALSACVLTYAVVTHRLLDVRVVARRAIIYAVLYGGALGILYVLALVALRPAPGRESMLLPVIIFAGIPVILLLSRKVHDLWQRKVEQAFIGERYSYRRQLSKFIDKIQDVPTLEQLGAGFIPLLAGSLDCRRACLLVPDALNEWFSARFTHPPTEDNPMREMRLKWDNPVAVWLEREKKILPVRNLDILPEFQSVWAKEREETQLAGVSLFIPLLNNERLVAILAVTERRDGKSYAVEDYDWLESIAVRVAASLERRYSDEQSKEQDAQTSLVNRLAGIMTSSMSIQMNLENLAQQLPKEGVDIDWATIALIDGEEICFVGLSSTIGSPWHPQERIPLEGTATEVACREKRAVYEPDLRRQHKYWTWESHVKQGISSVLYLPMSAKSRIIGTLILASRKPNAYNRSQIRWLERVALQIGVPIGNAQLYAQVERRSRVDELTGLFNRRHFEERLKEEVARHSRYGAAFSIFMVDLDNFKTYNDLYGHPAGDSLLSEIGGTIKRCVRDADQAFRYGGDEFVVILPETARDDAYVVAERVREQIAADMEKKSITVTCSIGLASYPLDGVIAGELVTGADTALYYAKWTGGNRTYFSSGVSSGPPEDGRTRGRRNGLKAVYDLVEMVESRDPYLHGHSRGVNVYAVALAEAMGMSPDEVSRVSTAALLHDVGKIGIRDEIWNKKEKLTKEDWDAIKTHPRLGANIVGNMPQLVPCVNSILHHHERWDGTGYPDGLKGEDIPVEGRILAIADTFEAMSSERPYRPPFSRQQVIEEIKRCAGSQFDPNLVDLFIGIVESGLPEKVKTGSNAADERTNP